MNLEKMRDEYLSESFTRSDLDPTPYSLLDKWIDQAIKLDIKYPNAAALATVDKNNRPSNRMVLVKETLEEGVIFYTDYTGAKAVDLLTNRNAAVTFYWKELDRQIRIQGTTTKIDPEKSEEYFLSRPFESKISALASNQSSPITKDELDRRVAELKEMHKDGDVPYPHNWGGYLVSLDSIEFWQGRPNRLHDRYLYTKDHGEWKIQRLAP